MSQTDDTQTVIVEWNGVSVPAELRGLPPGRYRVEPADWELTAEEDTGIEEALASAERGELTPASEVFERLRKRYAPKP